MKRFASILAVVALILSACNRDPDTRAQKLLVGTWSLTFNYQDGDTTTSTLIIGPDGKYVCRVVTHGHSGTERTYDRQGTLQVQNGVLIDTMTNTGATKLTRPLVDRSPIVRIDNREFLVRWERIAGVSYPTNEPLFRKISK